MLIHKTLLLFVVTWCVILNNVYCEAPDASTHEDSEANRSGHDHHHHVSPPCHACDDKDLKLVHVIYRHGERTPADTYPNDIHINETFHPFGWGQLTNNGKRQLYNNGKWMRNRYDKFLGHLYFPSIFSLQTTDSDRTKMSGQLVSAGLWPPALEQDWSKGELNWMPMPAKVEPLNQDNLLLVRKPCAQYSLEREAVEQSEEVQNLYNKHKDVFEELTKHTGFSVANAENMLDVYGTIRAESDFGLQIPEWAKKHKDILKWFSEYSFILNAKNDKLKRLKGGVFLKKILKDWKDKAAGSLKEKKMFMYVGHDSTIANLLSALNVWDQQIPEYAITILLELSQHKTTHEFGVEVFLKNSTWREPHALKIPGCDYFCPLNQVVKLTESVIPVNWEEECKSDDPNYVPPPPGGP